MSVILGSGEHRYRVVENWAKLPDGWEFRDVAAVAVDSKDRVYVFNRGQHPMMVFDRDGNFLRSWGEGLFSRAHGIHIDSDDTLYCTDDGDHTVRKITTDGKVLLTIGVPNQPAPFLSGKPFNRCTHTALSPKGEIYVSDGYGNSCVHKYSPDGKHLMCWGTTGTDPGQFNIVHNIVTDEDGWVYVADRENHRVQVFDGNGKYEMQWNNMHRPCALYCSRRRQESRSSSSASWDPACRSTASTPTSARASPSSTRRARRSRGWAASTGPARRPGKFLSPHGLAVDSKGDIYVGEVSYTNWPSTHPGVPVPKYLRSLQKLEKVALMEAPGERLHLIGSIPLDSSEQVFRTLADELGPFSPHARRRDRRALALGLFPAPDAARPSRHGDRSDGAALQVRPMGRQGRARDRAGALQARRRSGDGGVRDRLRQGGAGVLGGLQAAARRRRDPQARALPGLPADAAVQRLPLCQRPGARDLFRRLRTRAEGGAGQHRQGDPGRGSRRSSGTSARKCWPSRTTSRTARPTTRSRPSTCWAGWAMPCRPASRWAITSATARRATSIWSSPRMPPSWSR